MELENAGDTEADLRGGRRKPNYSAPEVEFLLSMIEQNSKLLMQTGVKSNMKAKNTFWQKLADELSSGKFGPRLRTAEECRVKWTNLNQLARRFDRDGPQTVDGSSRRSRSLAGESPTAHQEHEWYRRVMALRAMSTNSTVKRRASEIDSQAANSSEAGGFLGENGVANNGIDSDIVDFHDESSNNAYTKRRKMSPKCADGKFAESVRNGGLQRQEARAIATANISNFEDELRAGNIGDDAGFAAIEHDLEDEYEERSLKLHLLRLERRKLALECRKLEAETRAWEQIERTVASTGTLPFPSRN